MMAINLNREFVSSYKTDFGAEQSTTGYYLQSITAVAFVLSKGFWYLPEGGEDATFYDPNNELYVFSQITKQESQTKCYTAINRFLKMKNEWRKSVNKKTRIAGQDANFWYVCLANDAKKLSTIKDYADSKDKEKWLTSTSKNLVDDLNIKNQPAQDFEQIEVYLQTPEGMLKLAVEAVSDFLTSQEYEATEEDIARAVMVYIDTVFGDYGAESMKAMSKAGIPQDKWNESWLSPQKAQSAVFSIIKTFKASIRIFWGYDSGQIPTAQEFLDSLAKRQKEMEKQIRHLKKRAEAAEERAEAAEERAEAAEESVESLEESVESAEERAEDEKERREAVESQNRALKRRFAASQSSKKKEERSISRGDSIDSEEYNSPGADAEDDKTSSDEEQSPEGSHERESAEDSPRNFGEKPYEDDDDGSEEDEPPRRKQTKRKRFESPAHDDDADDDDDDDDDDDAESEEKCDNPGDGDKGGRARNLGSHRPTRRRKRN